MRYETPGCGTAYGRGERVLEACGIKANPLGDWDIEALNALPNMRLQRPAPHRHQTPWRVLQDEVLSALPSPGSLLIDIRDWNSTDSEAQVFEGNGLIQFTSDEWSTWVKHLWHRCAV